MGVSKHSFTISPILCLLLTTPIIFEPSCQSQQGNNGESKSTQTAVSRPPKRSNYRAALRDGTDLCDTDDANCHSNRYGRENLDILARARQAIAVKAALNLPEPKHGLVSLFALEAMLEDDRLGDFTNGDDYAKMIGENGDYYDLEAISNCVTELAATGRTKESELLQKFIASQPGYNPNWKPRSQNQQDQDRVVENLHSTTQLTRHCADAITADDKGAVTASLEQLFSRYENEPDQPEWQPPGIVRRQNLFCTILDLARKLSDHHWYSESSSALRKLALDAKSKNDWTAACGFIEVEQAINEEREKRTSPRLWHQLEDDIAFAMYVTDNRRSSDHSLTTDPSPKKTTTYDLTKSDKLRRLAVLFYDVGEIERAGILIDHALEAFTDKDVDETPEHRIIHCTDKGVGDQVILWLDAACIKAKQNNFTAAANFADKALKRPPLTESAYGAKLAELCSIYVHYNRKAEAVALLQKARDKNIQPALRMPRDSNSSAYVVDYWLAKYLYDDGKISQARTIIDSAIEQAVHPIQSPGATERIPTIRADNYAYAPAVLSGHCAFAAKDFAAASMRYEQAGLSRSIGTLPIFSDPTVSQYWLQKSISCAQEASNFPKESMARLYMELGTAYKRTSPDKTFANYKQAIALMDDSNPKKSTLLGEMALLSRQLKYSTSDSNTPGDSSAEHFIDPTHSKEPAKREESESPELTLLRESAQLAEKNSATDSFDRYKKLANSEAIAGDLDQAQKDCEHAISLFGAAQSYPWYNHAALSTSDQVIYVMANKGRSSDAAALLEQACVRVSALKGVDSDEALEQLYQLMRFYLDAKDNVKASITLDRVLAHRMKPTIRAALMFYGSHSYQGVGLEPIYSWAKVAASADPQLAQEILNKTLNAQNKQLPSDDLKFAGTYLALGDLAKSQHESQNELAAYQKAFNLNKLYYGETMATTKIPLEYFDLLRTSGKTEEADRLEALYKSRFDRTSASQARSHFVSPKDIDLDGLRKEYETASTDAPYGAQTEQLLSRLTSAARFQKSWTLAIECVNKKLALADHFQEDAKTKQTYQKELVEIYIEAARFDDATALLDKVIDDPTTPLVDRNYLPQKLFEAYASADNAAAGRDYLGKLIKTGRIKRMGPDQETTLKSLLSDTYVNMATGRTGVAVNLNGGRNSNGGNARSDPYQDPLQMSLTHWTFRALDCRAIVFPSYFVTHRSGVQKRFEISAKEHIGDDTDAHESSNMHHWYEAFTEALVNDFAPTVRGAIGANIRIKEGGVESIAFYGYKYKIGLMTNVPPGPEPANNQDELKASILRALKQATSEPEVALPKEVDSVDVKVLFGGDPKASGATWEGLALIDDLNGDITLPK
ncbi:MAG TPA: hypothetical protein V6C81_14060 [Planktothrix sp.]